MSLITSAACNLVLCSNWLRLVLICCSCCFLIPAASQTNLCVICFMEEEPGSSRPSEIHTGVYRQTGGWVWNWQTTFGQHDGGRLRDVHTRGYWCESHFYSILFWSGLCFVQSYSIILCTHLWPYFILQIKRVTTALIYSSSLHLNLIIHMNLAYYTHTRWFLWFMGTLHRRNGFYIVQTVFSIALHQPYP